jgi:GNAT superfamily N-acetyltransferase
MSGIEFEKGDLKMANINYMEVGDGGLDRIKPLWEKLIEHIKARSTYFCEWFEARAFEERRAELLSKAAVGKLYVDLAMDGGQLIGYCVSSISYRRGEIDSIFIEEMYRSSGIGGELMKRALSWMEDEPAESVRIAASIGNEEVMPFYRRCGFFPKHTLLELKKEIAEKG